MQLKIAGIVKESVVDGPGIRLVVFVQGCPHHCPGCHNPASHDPSGGSETSTEAILKELEEDKLVSGITLSGGEPFLQPEALVELAAEVKRRGLSVVTYSGYVYEELLAMGKLDEKISGLLQLTDILVDGPYLQERRDIGLAFRGSGNQRLIDVPSSLRLGRVVEWSDPAWQS